MKYFEREFYRGYWFFGNGSSQTIKDWLEIKDTVFRGLKHVTKRHRRSVAQRRLHRLFSHLVVCMGYVWLRDDAEAIFPLEYPRRKNGIKACRRLWIGK